jgi:hypothetical protein
MCTASPVFYSHSLTIKIKTMAKQFYGSINLTKILEQAKEKHTAFQKAANGNVYFNINVWLNDEPDKYGNILSLKLSATKEAIAADETTGKIYIGNCKENENVSAPLSDNDAALFANILDGQDDLLF